MVPAPGEDSVNIVQMKKGLKYYICIVVEATAECGKNGSDFEILLWVKCYQTTTCAPEKYFIK